MDESPQHQQPGHYQQPGYYPQPGYYEQLGSPWNATAPMWTPPAPARATRRRRLVIGSVVVAALAVMFLAGIITARSVFTVAGQGAGVAPDVAGNGSTGSGSGGTGSGGSGGSSSGGSGGSTSGGATSTGTASAAQQVGVVDIDTVLQYQGEQAAGTGLVLTSSGVILTNNHVIDGSTSITVTVVSTGRTYRATVVGTDPTQDVAVLQLKDASGLKTANISTSARVSVGDAVTAVGNAGGSGGTPSSASGTVVAVNQSITASDDSGQNAENLTGLIESDAPIQPGDSGGPLYNSSGQIIGIDTAGSSFAGGRSSSSSGATQAYSIPISTAVAIATKIENGEASSTIHLGYPAFLGVQIAESNEGGRFGTNSGAGALISGVVSGTPAAQAGLAAGDTITTIGSTAISSANDLQTALASHQAGQSVKVAWTDASGQTHSATVQLIAGPAD